MLQPEAVLFALVAAIAGCAVGSLGDAVLFAQRYFDAGLFGEPVLL